MVNKLLIKTYLAAGLLIPSTYLYAQSSRADTLFREGKGCVQNMNLHVRGKLISGPRA